MTRNERIALFASLAVNVFFLGAAVVLIGGLLMRGPRFPDHKRFEPHPGGPFLSRILPEDTLARLKPELDEKRKAARAAFDDARKAREAALQTLAAEPYSKEASAEAFAKARDADVKAVTLAQDILSGALLSLNDDERKQAYAKLSAFMTNRGDEFHIKGGDGGELHIKLPKEMGDGGPGPGPGPGPDFGGPPPPLEP